ncbi:e3 ubiquitin-protein ligase pub1 [Moniliophthora roreri]|nr:e3 ubiquitin-protein ligase pub1 [Moniliophthora roreri]
MSDSSSSGRHRGSSSLHIANVCLNEQLRNPNNILHFTNKRYNVVSYRGSGVCLKFTTGGSLGLLQDVCFVR